MANRQAGIHQRMAGDLFRRPGAARRVRRLLIDAGVVLISAAGSAIIAHAASPSGGVHGWACELVAFLLFLLGVWMAMLALVAGRFLGAERIGVAIATALHRYMFGRER
ncbi:unnamed protein product [Urochloa decumbens]|uniref:Uncharacterized protein n=1 Tax=Urochloa decumbens TaxID=240449 RepID=A0ABC9E1Y3_9POAL